MDKSRIAAWLVRLIAAVASIAGLMLGMSSAAAACVFVGVNGVGICV